MRRQILRRLLSFSLLAGAAAPLALGTQVAAAPPDKPNIILISTDDQSVLDMKYMPYTRQLLGGTAGATFRNALSPYPLCCPARATIVTGQHAHNHGVLSNKAPSGGYEGLRPLNDRTLPVWMHNAGYRTTFTGKYLNGYGEADPREVPPGWDNWHATVRGTYDYDSTHVNENGVVVDHTGEYQADITQRVTEEAITEGVATGQPFFIWQSDLAPHGACEKNATGCRWVPPKPAPQDVGTFKGEPSAAEHDPSFNERVVVEKPQRIRKLARFDGKYISRLRYINERRIESLQAVDRNVRDTVQLLDRLGQLDNTLIVFTSDNGLLLGQHRYKGKVLAYEASLRVPLYMRGPGVPAGRVDGMVSLVDVAATFAEAGNANPLLTLDGVSLRDVANGSVPAYNAIAIEAGPAFEDVPQDKYLYRGVRTPRYTYLVYPVTHEVELYDRKVDPYQLVNVAYRPTHAETRKALDAILQQLKDCSGSACHAATGSVPAPQPPQGPVHPDELGKVGRSRQVVTVTASSWSEARGVAVAWQKTGRAWYRVRGPVPVKLGARGMARLGEWRTGETVGGVHDVLSAFGKRVDPGGELTYRRIDANDRWPFDPESAATYNVFQTSRSGRATWRPRFETVFSAHPGSFDRALVTGYNRARRIYWSSGLRQRMAADPADVRRGSLLINTGTRVGPNGWVSMPTRDLTWLVRWSDPAQHPKIVVGTPKYLRGVL